MAPTLGRIVHFRVTFAQAEQVMRRRTNGRSIAERLQLCVASDMGEDDVIYGWPVGAQAHIGNPVQAGDVLPMLVTYVNRDGSINGQVFLDGNDVLWVTNVLDGTEPGTWAWPARVV